MAGAAGGWESEEVFDSVQVPSSWLDLPISMVSSATETKTYPTTFGEVLEGIRAGKWEKIVKRVQERYAKAFKTAEEEGKPDPAAAAKKAANSLKLKMPAVTCSGAFSERADSAIEYAFRFSLRRCRQLRGAGGYARKTGERSLRASGVHLANRNRLQGARPNSGRCQRPRQELRGRAEALQRSSRHSNRRSVQKPLAPLLRGPRP